MFDASQLCGPVAEATMQTFGGFAFAREYDIERKWRECRLYQIAPISSNLILAYVAEHVLGMPRSHLGGGDSLIALKLSGFSNCREQSHQCEHGLNCRH